MVPARPLWAAADNGDETIKFDEENGGNINAHLDNVDVSGGGDDGIQLEAADAGQLHVHMRDVTSIYNKKCGANLISGSGKGWLKLNGDNEFWTYTVEDGDCPDSGEIEGIELDGVDLK